MLIAPSPNRKNKIIKKKQDKIFTGSWSKHRNGVEISHITG